MKNHMKILVVVDMQKDFIDGSLGTAEAQAIVPKVANLIKESANEDTAIIFTADSHEENYMETLEGKNLPVPHCIVGTDGWYIHPDITEAYIEVVDVYRHVNILNSSFDACNRLVRKPSFGSIEFQNILYEIDEMDEPIEEITFCGLCTGICVLSNAILAKATLPEVPINVVKDCCACVTPESHQTALDAMKLCQINII
jgi:nicotinamidase-related amidase